MSKRAKNHLRKLAGKDENHLLQGLLQAYIADPESLDTQITLLGAMRQAGWEDRQTMPYWYEWRPDEDAWIHRCLERLILNFKGDLFAVPSLLSFSPQEILSIARPLFPHLVHAGTWRPGEFSRDAPDQYFRVSFAQEWNRPGSNGAHRCIELAWQDDVDSLIEFHYTKVLANGEVHDYLNGLCGQHHITTATWPDGFWHVPHSSHDFGRLEDVLQAIESLPPGICP